MRFKKRFLAPSRVDILTAGDGTEALEVAHRELPDLIVMDKYMPKMDGIACCTAIKTDPFLKHIPVIIVSNTAQPADLDEYSRIGCNDYLSKPIDSKLFLNTIKKYLPSIERRGSRVPCHAEVQLIFNGVVHRGISEDISLSGIYVTTDLSISRGEELQLAFVLPGSDSQTEARGKVAWVNRGLTEKSGLTPGLGIEFLEITGKGIQLLRTSELKGYLSSALGIVLRGSRVS